MRKVTTALLLHARGVIDQLLNIQDPDLGECGRHSPDDSPEENEVTEIHGSLNDLHARTNVLDDNVAAIFKTGSVRDKRLCTNEDAIGALAERIGQSFTKGEDNCKATYQLSQEIRAIKSFVEAQRGLNESNAKTIEDLKRRAATMASRCDAQGEVNNSFGRLVDSQKAIIDANDVDINKRVGALEANVSDLVVEDRVIVARIEELEKQPLAASHNHLCKATDERFTALEVRLDVHEERLDIQRNDLARVAKQVAGEFEDRDYADLNRRVETLTDNHGHMTGRLDVVAKTVNANSEAHRNFYDRFVGVEKRMGDLEIQIIHSAKVYK